MRPKIIGCMTSSISGRLPVDRWTEPAGGAATNIVQGTYEQVAERFGDDEWIVSR